MGRKKKKATGATRMVELGYRAVKVWFTHEQLEEIAERANAAGIPVATWIRSEVNRAVIEQQPVKKLD